MISPAQRRAVIAVGLALAGLLASAAPAAAHTITGVASTNYESVLLGPAPTVRGVSVRLRDLGRRVEVANSTNTDLVISGYHDEPFLRVGPGGVFQNLRSPTVYENRSTITGLPYPVPPDASASAAPEWSRLNGDHVVRWRDRRTRHEGATPASVRQSPRQSHVVSTWSLLMQSGSTQIVANGIIRWVPAPNPLPWLAFALVVGIGVVVASRSNRWGPVLGAATAAAVAVDITHAVVAIIPASDSLTQTILKLFAARIIFVFTWVVGGVGAALLGRKNLDGLFLGVFVALILLLTGGLSDVTILGRSQVPYAVDPVIGRLLVSLTIGLASGVLFRGVQLLRRIRPRVL